MEDRSTPNSDMKFDIFHPNAFDSLIWYIVAAVVVGIVAAVSGGILYCWFCKKGGKLYILNIVSKISRRNGSATEAEGSEGYSKVTSGYTHEYLDVCDPGSAEYNKVAPGYSHEYIDVCDVDSNYYSDAGDFKKPLTEEECEKEMKGVKLIKTISKTVTKVYQEGHDSKLRSFKEETEEEEEYEEDMKRVMPNKTILKTVTKVYHED